MTKPRSDLPQEDSFQDIVQQIKRKKEWREQGRCINIGDLLGKKSYFVYPQESLIITGDTGLGKSAITDWIMVRSGLNVLKLNNELPNNVQTTRMVQTIHAMSESDAEDFIINYAENEPGLGNISLMHGHKTLDQIYETAIRLNVDVLCIDTTDGIDFDGKNDNDRLRRIILSLNFFVKKHDMILWAVHHPRKLQEMINYQTHEATRQKNMTLSTLAGVNHTVTKFQHVLAVEGESVDNPVQPRVLRCLKSNTATLWRHNIWFDFERWQIVDNPHRSTKHLPIFDDIK